MGNGTKGFSVFQRTGRPVWYIKIPDAGSADGWRNKATDFLVTDPAGKRRAIAEAERLTGEFRRIGAAMKREAWTQWVTPFLLEKYGNSPLTHASYSAAWELLHEFLREKNIHVPARLRYTHVVEYLAWRTGQKRHSGKPIARNTALQNVRVLSLIMREADLPRKSPRPAMAANPPCACQWQARCATARRETRPFPPRWHYW